MNSYQLKNAEYWLFSIETLDALRTRANSQALRSIVELNMDEKDKLDKNKTSDQSVCPNRFPSISVYCFTSGLSTRHRNFTEERDNNFTFKVLPKDFDPSKFLTPREENLLLRFYASKLFSLIGPNAQIPRLRKESKVAYTAALFFKRFYLSNSVMMYDPKRIMVGAAFLASKVEDSTVDINNLEDGTRMMNSVVLVPDIINAEMSLIAGINFRLHCHHPYNVVLAIADDLRTFLKSDHGKKFCSLQEESKYNLQITGEDLRLMHIVARKIVDDIIVSDIPLIASPGQIGLASMMIANQELLSSQSNISVIYEEFKHRTRETVIYFHGYIRSRFTGDYSQENVSRIINILEKVCYLFKESKEELSEFGHQKIELGNLKAIHKRLKKCWQLYGNPSIKKKKRKRNQQQPL